MATTVDQLVVEIRAETAGLRKGLDGVNRRLAKANRTAKASILTFQNLAKVFAVMGLARLGGSVVRTTQMFEDLEATLLANTRSATETAEALDMIKEFTATTTFQIEQVTGAFIEFRRVGVKPTIADLKGIGNVAAAQNKSIDQVAQAIFRASTTSIESLQMMGFTGKMSGDEITLSFGDVTETMKKTTENVMGFVRRIGEEKFSDAIEARANTLSGAFSNLGDATALFMAEIGEGGLKSVLIDLARGMSGVLNNSLDLARSIGQGMRVAFSLLGRAIDAAKASLKELMDGFVVFISMLIVAKILSITTALIQFVRTTTMAAASVKLLNLILRRSPWVIAATGILALTGNLEELANKIKSLISALDEQFGVTETLADMYSGIASDADELAVATEGLTDHMDAFGDAGSKAAEGVQTFGEAMTDAVTTTSHAFTKDFTDALLSGRDALESFKDFSRNIVSQIIAIFLQMAVVNKILNSIFGGHMSEALPEIDVANFFGGGSAGGGNVPGTTAGGAPGISSTSGLVIGGGSIAPPVLTPPPGRAGGGSIRGPMLVGERGPEIFMPHAAGRIMNNADSKSALGGGTVVVNQSINFSTGIVPPVRAEVTRMLPQIAEVSKVAVLDAARRGGSFRRGLVGA